MTATLDQFEYSYQFASRIDDHGIHLATCDRPHQREDIPRQLAEDGPFLQSRLTYPRPTARMLRALSRVVRTHYFDARPPQFDPIATASRNTLRFEGFSGCCGVYVRLDLDRDALQARQMRLGTTNVDFNHEMIQHLDRIGSNTDVSLDISPESIALQHSGNRVVEKKVTLPARWVKGLCEVQVFQSRLRLAHRFSPGSLMPLLQKAGNGMARGGVGRGGRQQTFLSVKNGKPWLSQRATSEAISVGGMNRLDSLRGILPLLQEVCLYSDPESGVHAWMGEAKSLRYWLVLSPELYRGFSGEGQVLSTLATADWDDRIEALEAWLAGRRTTTENLIEPAETIDPAEIASSLGWSLADAQATLAALATSGLAGFDASTGYYFQRKLPFQLARLEKDQPRLRSAKKLLAEGAVRLIEAPDSHSPSSVAVEVHSGEITYFVRLAPQGDTCTCPWFSRYQGDRGPCKHVLAARMMTQRENTP